MGLWWRVNKVKGHEGPHADRTRRELTHLPEVLTPQVLFGPPAGWWGPALPGGEVWVRWTPRSDPWDGRTQRVRPGDTQGVQPGDTQRVQPERVRELISIVFLQHDYRSGFVETFRFNFCVISWDCCYNVTKIIKWHGLNNGDCKIFTLRVSLAETENTLPPLKDMSNSWLIDMIQPMSSVITLLTVIFKHHRTKHHTNTGKVGLWAFCINQTTVKLPQPNQVIMLSKPN